MRHSETFLDQLSSAYRSSLQTGNIKTARYILTVCDEIGIIRYDGMSLDLHGDHDTIYMSQSDASDDEGRWITAENGHRVHINGEGQPDIGNPNVLKAMGEKTGKGKTTKNSRLKITSGSAAAKDNRLGKQYSAKAQNVYDRMRANEPKITDDICDIADAAGCEMSGLQYSVKTASSVADKIKRKKEKNPDAKDEDIVSAMGDIVRYTALGPHNELASKTEAFIDQFESKGYNVTEVENKYLDEEPMYKGIHLSVVSPAGQKFEFQVHSEESLAIKNEIHPMYEEFRDVDTPAPRKAELILIPN